MKKCLLVVAMVVFGVGSVFAADNYWDGGGGDNNWLTAANWSLGVPYYSGDTTAAGDPPANESRAFIGRSFNGSTTVYVSGEAYGGAVWVAYGALSGMYHELVLNSDSSLYIRRMYTDTRGTITNNGGSFQLENLNFMSGSVVNMNGGLVDSRGDFWRISGNVYLNDGTFRIHNGTSFSYYSATLDDYNTEFTGLIDIYDGQFVMDGDCRNALQYHINNGNLLAHGGDSDYELQMSYDSQVGDYGTTTVEAVLVPEPATMLLLGLGGLVAARRRS